MLFYGLHTLAELRVVIGCTIIRFNSYCNDSPSDRTHRKGQNLASEDGLCNLYAVLAPNLFASIEKSLVFPE